MHDCRASRMLIRARVGIFFSVSYGGLRLKASLIQKVPIGRKEKFIRGRLINPTSAFNNFHRHVQHAARGHILRGHRLPHALSRLVSDKVKNICYDVQKYVCRRADLFVSVRLSLFQQRGIHFCDSTRLIREREMTLSVL